MTWPMMELGEVCEFENGDRGINYPSRDEFVDCGIPFINAGDIADNGISLAGLNYITQDKYTQLGAGKTKVGDIVFCLRGSIGKFALIKDLPQTAIASSLIIIRPSKAIDTNYLMQYLGSHACKKEISKFENGAAQPNLSGRDLKKFLIQIPPLEEQKRIAAILDKADSLRRKRAQAIALADDFLRATFLEMFGDPVTNPKGWPVKKLGEIGTLDRGISKHRPRNDPSLLGGAYPLIQTGEVSKSDGYIRSYTATYSDKGLQQSKMWPKGTLCITIAANIAKTGILRFDACFPDSVVGFSAVDSATVEYVRIWLSFLQKTLEDNAPESAQKNINLAILRDLNIPTPPIELKKRFEQTVITVNNLKEVSSNALAVVASLSEACQSQVF
ncbi:restriction endonuclease subunit S [Deefgea tanakiae]|uniref:Restriction endonuclease subunit S n=1 Tax=Deefgea tanakiae TaxID=2865840 RepID=A0ABX8Z8Q0_9NEIS|nr:restriction endonuclease subunit S [Deefgea tanakiae]QZA78692.1 restriction endonuclease subunit S [Deefgea tanakiae]